MAQRPLKKVNFHDLDSSIQHLLREAVEARKFSHSPYSHFPVGASILCADGTVVRGCNVENASYSCSICAEQTAYVKAISEGRNEFRAVAVVAQQERNVTTPCGYCRQVMSEFGNCAVYLSQPDLRDVYVTSVDELLPLQFNGEQQITAT